LHLHFGFKQWKKKENRKKRKEKKKNLFFHIQDISLRFEKAESLEKFYRREVVLLVREYFLGRGGGQVE